jgi:hypothetical protein
MGHELAVLAGIGDFITGAAFAADATEARLRLKNIAAAARERLGDLRFGHRGEIASSRLLPVDVAGARFHPKPHRAGTGAVGSHHFGRILVGVVDEENEEPGRGGVETAAMPHFDEVELALHRLDDGGESDACGLVDQQKAVKPFEHPQLSEIGHRLTWLRKRRRSRTSASKVRSP